MGREFTLSYLTTAPMGVSEAPLSPGCHFCPLCEDAVLLRDTLAFIQDTGVAAFDVEGVRLDEQFRQGSFDRQLGIAAKLGAKVISVIGDDPDEQRLIDSFAQLCDAAAPYTLAVALEFMPYSLVADANGELRILRHAQRSNAQIAVDFLHVNRS